MQLATVFGSFWSGWVLRGYQQRVTWLRRIAPYTPGAVPTACWDQDRAQATSFSDGTFGVGWRVVDSKGVTRNGYYGPQTITVGIDDMATAQRLQDYGVVSYEGPVIFYQPPVLLTKGDVIVRPDGSRCAVGDTLTPAQVMGQAVLYTNALEQRTTLDPIYQIPLV